MKVIVCAIAALLISSSSLGAQDIGGAKSAALNWLAELDAGKYQSTWKDASPLFRQRVPEQRWVNAVSRVRGSLGKLESRRFKDAIPRTHLPGVPDGHYMVLQFVSRFANKSSAIETVTPMLSDGKWKVSGYYVR